MLRAARAIGGGGRASAFLNVRNHAFLQGRKQVCMKENDRKS